MSDPGTVTPRPLLFVQPRLDGERSKINSGVPPATSGPGPARQDQRMGPRFSALRSAMSHGGLSIAGDVVGHDPELVVVLEVLGTMEEFAAAASLVPGLEFLVEIAEGAVEPAEGFTTANPSGLVNETLYVLAQNAQALAQIQRMWTLWKADQKVRLDRGFNPWKQVFALLADVRPWGPSDRVRDSALDQFWGPELAAGSPVVHAEAELWFRRSAALRAAAERELRTQVALAGGRVLDAVQIEDIAYHAILLELPATVARATLTGVSFLVNDPRVSYVRPQTLPTDTLPEAVTARARAADDSNMPTNAPPLVAVLDAMPLLGHARLRGRLQIDDPADVDARVPTQVRNHGSTVCSLVLWGDLERGGAPLRRRVVMHPILATASKSHDGERDAMDNGVLPVRVTRDILNRLLIGSRDEPAVAPTVRIVVLAVGHTALPFGNRLSPWARLLDVYANRHNVLFIVSAGNYDAPIDLGTDVPVDTLQDPAALHRAVQRYLFDHAHERRILSPSDSMNALTVGALHHDVSGVPTTANALDLIDDAHVPSPISGLGGGYRRQMKPEVFADGGKVLYRHRWDVEDRLVFDRALGRSVGGLRAAAAGEPGDLTAEWWAQGTSAATAFLGHEAGQVAELLADDRLVDDRFLGVATKALLLNSASWSGGERAIAGARSITNAGEVRKEASRLLGFGSVHPDRIAICTDKRVTVVGTGTLYGEDAMVLELPVPASLNGRAEVRRVSVTATWFTPVNPRNMTYRQAKVWFEVLNAREFGIKSQQGEMTAVKRGASQHEVFEGDRAVTVAPNAALRIRVNCARNAGMGTQPVPIALVATFEMAETSPVRVYDEIRAALQIQAAVRAGRTRVR